MDGMLENKLSQTRAITKRDHTPNSSLSQNRLMSQECKKSDYKRAMMALNRSPESVSPQNEFYLLYYYSSNYDPWDGASFDPKGIIWIELI